MASSQNTSETEPCSSSQSNSLALSQAPSGRSKGKGRASPTIIPTISLSEAMDDIPLHDDGSDWPFGPTTRARGPQTRSDVVRRSPYGQDPAGRLRVDPIGHSRQNSIEMLGTPRPDETAKPQKKKSANPKAHTRSGSFPSLGADEMKAGPSGRIQRERLQVVLRDPVTGKLYDCNNLLEIGDGLPKPQVASGLTVPTLRLQNSDGTFTMLDEAASSTDTIVTCFPPPNFDTAATSSVGEAPGSVGDAPGSHPQPEPRLKWIVRQWRMLNNSPQSPEARVVHAALTIPLGFVTFAWSSATVFKLRLAGLDISTGVMAWLILSTIFFASTIVFVMIAYFDYRGETIASGDTEAGIELEDRRDRGATRSNDGVADQSDQGSQIFTIGENQEGEEEEEEEEEGEVRRPEPCKLKSKQKEIELHATEHASSHIAKPAAILSENDNYLSPSFGPDPWIASSSRTLTKVAATPFYGPMGTRSGPSSQTRRVSPSGSTKFTVGTPSSKSSILAELCEAGAEPYSPLGESSAQGYRRGLQEPEFR